MKYIFKFLALVFIGAMMFSCRSTKKIQTAINKKDTSTVIMTNTSNDDSLGVVKDVLNGLKTSHIDFKTFSSKIKVEYVDSKSKQSNVTAYVNIMKDSMIWVSLYATIFNIEAFRVLIKKDSVIVVDKINKEVQYRTLSYLQDVTEIPFDFKTLQNMLVGNPIYFDSDNVVSYKQIEDIKLVTSVGQFFKHLLTIDNNGVILKSKLDDVDVNRHRTADLTYSDYVISNGINFSTYRDITVSEKNKLEIRLHFKQFDFNKELSFSFNVPKNYKKR